MDRRFVLLLANISLFCTGCVVPPMGPTGMICIGPPMCANRAAPLRPPQMSYAPMVPPSPHNGRLFPGGHGVARQRAAFRQEKFAYVPKFGGHVAQWPDDGTYEMTPHYERRRKAKEKSTQPEYAWDKLRRSFKLFEAPPKRRHQGEIYEPSGHSGCCDDACFDCARSSCCAPTYPLDSCGCRRCTGCSGSGTGCGEAQHQTLGLPHHQPQHGCNCHSNSGVTHQRQYHDRNVVDVTHDAQASDIIENMTVQQVVPAPVPPADPPADPAPSKVPAAPLQNRSRASEEPPSDLLDGDMLESPIQPIALWIPKPEKPEAKPIRVEAPVETVVIPGKRVQSKRIQ